MLSSTRRRWIGAMLAGALVATMTSCTSDPSWGPRGEPAIPADEVAAGGPLVGDPSLVPDELTCTANEGNEPWYPGMAAFEVHDSGRTHLYGCATFPGSTSDANQVFAYQSDDIYVTPYNIVDRGPTSSSSMAAAMATAPRRRVPSCRAWSRAPSERSGGGCSSTPTSRVSGTTREY